MKLGNGETLMLDIPKMWRIVWTWLKKIEREESKREKNFNEKKWDY